MSTVCMYAYVCLCIFMYEYLYVIYIRREEGPRIRRNYIGFGISGGLDAISAGPTESPPPHAKVLGAFFHPHVCICICI